MHHMYGVDLAGGVLGRRSWRWFSTRVVRLLAEDTMLARELGLRPTAGKTRQGDGR